MIDKALVFVHFSSANHQRLSIGFDVKETGEYEYRRYELALQLAL